MSDLVGLVRLEGRKLTVTLDRGIVAIESRVDESGASARIAVPKSALVDVIKLLQTAREELAVRGAG